MPNNPVLHTSWPSLFISALASLRPEKSSSAASFSDAFFARLSSRADSFAVMTPFLTRVSPTDFTFAAASAETDFPAALRSSVSSCLTMLFALSAWGRAPVLMILSSCPAI